LERVRTYAETIPTTGLLVVVGGRVLFEYGDVEEVSYLASVRKSILAMLYGNYVADGTIDLEKTLEELGMDDVGGLLPVERQAKVLHLVTARSGVYHPASNPGDNLADAPARGSQEPGTYMLYSNWDFNAAGGAFELMTGRDIFDALQTDLAEPLEFQDFDRSLHRKGGDRERSLYPSYHMHLSTRDMARAGYLMLREGNWKGEQVIPADWARETTVRRRSGRSRADIPAKAPTANTSRSFQPSTWSSPTKPRSDRIGGSSGEHRGVHSRRSSTGWWKPGPGGESGRLAQLSSR
jgi:CubicO group peptidase (beta-lactamase class C family)